MSALELLAAEEHELRSRPAGLPSLAADHQTFLAHVARSRKAQRLPPFFALITGPTLQQPYKMEEMCITLGRVTQARRMADIHVSDSPSLSHHHAQIEFRQNHNHYVLVNTSPNGTRMKTVDSDEWTDLTDMDESAPLPNPAIIELGGTFVFFQMFYVGQEERKPPRMVLRSLELLPATFAAAAKAGTITSAKGGVSPASAKPTANKGTRPGGMPFSELIMKALVALGGRASQRQIAEFIEATYPEVSQRSNWRNSISGALSVNSPDLWEAVPVVLPNGKRARYLMWNLKNTPAAAHSELAATGSPSVVFNVDAPPPTAASSEPASEDVALQYKPLKKKPGPKKGWKIAKAAALAEATAQAAALGLPPPEPPAPKKKKKKPKEPKEQDYGENDVIEY